MKCACEYEYQVVLTLQRTDGPRSVFLVRTMQFCGSIWRRCQVIWSQHVQPALVSFCVNLRDRWLPEIWQGLTAAFSATVAWLQKTFASPVEISEDAPPTQKPPVELPKSDGVFSSATTSLVSDGSLQNPLPSQTSQPHVTAPLQSTGERAAWINPHDAIDFLASRGDTPVRGESPVASSQSNSPATLVSLARQMLAAKMYQEAYKLACDAVVADVTCADAWAARAVAAAYASTPPTHRLSEVKLCMSEALKSESTTQFILSLQDHLFDASIHYRGQLAVALRHAGDESQKEPLAANVDLNLQFVVRNMRVGRVQKELHLEGYVSSIELIEYAANLAPHRGALRRALSELDHVMATVGESGVVTFLKQDEERNHVLEIRQRLIQQLRQDDPTFVAPEAPEQPGCFIATAAAGNPDHPAVRELRKFRDEFLNSSEAGRWVVQRYYRYSPPLACMIARSASGRKITMAAIVYPASIIARTALRRCRRR